MPFKRYSVVGYRVCLIDINDKKNDIKYKYTKFRLYVTFGFDHMKYFFLDFNEFYNKLMTKSKLFYYNTVLVKYADSHDKHTEMALVFVGEDLVVKTRTETIQVHEIFLYLVPA